MARQSPGVWRLHPTLIAADNTFLEHARRRAAPLRPTDEGHFEFRRANVGEDDLGKVIFDAFIRYVPTQKERS